MRGPPYGGRRMARVRRDMCGAAAKGAFPSAFLSVEARELVTYSFKHAVACLTAPQIAILCPQCAAPWTVLRV
eukprot:270105-Lingulodinium_polyedra.AAC.1